MADSVASREVVAAVRIAATPASLDAAVWPADATVLRLAADEVLLLDTLDAAAPEPHAIVFPDTSWVRFALPATDGARLLEAAATWAPPPSGFAQGAVAGIPAKVLVGPERWWMVVQGVLADEFAERIEGVLA